jgi:hypothetical protein
MYLDDENDFGGDSDLDEFRETKSKTTKSSKPNSVCDLFSLYGNMDQHKRAEILAKFCKASRGILVCTVSKNLINISSTFLNEIIKLNRM